MKFSNYNIFIENENKDKNLLINTLSGNAFKIDSNLKSDIKNNNIDNINEKQLDIFRTHGIIIDKHIDEKKYIEYLYNKEKYSDYVLSLTVLLTYNCNLRCIYCYEGAGESKKGTLTDDTRENIYKFIIKQVEIRRSKIVNLVLFGGEPSLYLNDNINWLDKIKNYCNENGVILQTSMVTNGVLLTDKILDQLKEYNCNMIQITLDGIKEIHDKRRIYINGRGSFDEVLSGIKLVKARGDLANPVIRINIDKENINQTKELLDFLVKENLADCMIDFGIVKGGTDACAAYSGHCFVDDEIADILDNLWRYMNSIGLNPAVSPVRKNMYCGLYKDSSFTISPRGELYKCWEHVGEEQHVIGKIGVTGEIIDDKYAFVDWMTHNPINIKECGDCKYLPACGGGCGAISYEKSKTYHAKGCFKTKGVLEKEILYKFKDILNDEY